MSLLVENVVAGSPSVYLSSISLHSNLGAFYMLPLPIPILRTSQMRGHSILLNMVLSLHRLGIQTSQKVLDLE